MTARQEVRTIAWYPPQGNARPCDLFDDAQRCHIDREPWRAIIRHEVTVLPQFPHDEGQQLVILHRWHGVQGRVQYSKSISEKGEPPEFKDRAHRDPIRLLEQIADLPGRRVLRLGWTIEQAASIFASQCFHPCSLDQWAETVRREHLSKIDPHELIDGDASEIGQRLRLERFGLWLSRVGHDPAVYAIAAASEGDIDNLLIARVGSVWVRMAV